MLIKVKVQQLRVGMYIHEFCGSWMDHPFWRGSFLLDDGKVLQLILSSGIEEVVIDDSKGLEVVIDDSKGLGLEAVSETTHAEETATSPSAEAGLTPETGLSARAAVVRVSLAEEAARAAVVCSRSREAVTKMFQDVRMGKALDGNAAVPIVEEITESVLRNTHALVGLVRLKTKDNYTYMHSIAVCALMVALANTLELDEEEIREAGMAGLFHDIGKMATPIEIINKPGKLTESEFEVIKGHPREGERILLECSGISPAIIQACLHHHEKVDGSGYPHRQQGEDIHLFARMCAVCDVYDAITSTRAYKAGWEPSHSIRRMAQSRGTHFDQRIFDAFVRSLGIYPVGTLVRLESERLGIIVEQTEKLLSPVVKVFFSLRSQTRVPVQLVDLSKPGCRDRILSHEDPKEWRFHDVHTLWSGIAPEQVLQGV